MKTILYIEDDPNDSDLFAMVLERASPQTVLRIVPDSAEAVSYLEGRAEFPDRVRSPRPNLIVLELSSSFSDPMEFLTWLRKSSFSDIPAVVLSGTANRLELERAREFGALITIPKGNSLEELKTIVGFLLGLDLRTGGPGQTTG